MTPVSERELAQLLEAGLFGVAKVRWGWAALEGAELPASLPLVTLRRSVASAAPYLDMCSPGDLYPLVDTSLQVHTWQAEYEAARALNATVRGLILGAGWLLQAEVDDYEPGFRAWRISGEYMRAGEVVE